MANFFRCLSVLLLISALAAMLTLLAADAVNALHLTTLHERAGALSFMLIGASYLLLQFASRRPWSEKLKAIFMGIGFVFWGSVSLLPPGPWVTFMDTAVVLIFVLDLSLIILENLRQNRHD